MMDFRLTTGKKLSVNALDVIKVERNISGHAVVTTRYGKTHTTLDVYKTVKDEVKKQRNHNITDA